MGQDPSHAPQRAEPSRPDRLVSGGGGQRLGAGGRGGEKTGPNPTDRGKEGSKHHLLTDAKGVPLANSLTAANRNDVTELIPLVDAIPPVRGKRGRPRRRPALLYGDRAYDSHRHRMLLWARGIAPALARRNTEHGSGLGVHRWVVERTLSWLHQFRRLRVRYERRADIHEAFLTLGCIVICHNYLTGSFC
jgi:transposase